MKVTGKWLPWGGLLVVLAVLGYAKEPKTGETPKKDGISKGPRTVKPAEVVVAGATYRVTGPEVHKDMAVFLIHTSAQDPRNFLTLEEGLKDGVVKVSEMEKETVGRLYIDNQSDRPLYLQEGERLQGGKQDRTIVTSLVLPPKSGKTPVATFCIEQSRWQEGKTGRAFGFTVNSALAPKGVRGAAKFEGSQQRVWRCVRVQKASAKDRALAPNTNSSANELLDAPKVQQLSEEYAKALGGFLDKHRDAVGFVLVVNGQIEEANIYPNHALLAKLCPRLVRSYALQARLLRQVDKAKEPPTAAAVAAFMRDGKEKSVKDRKLEGDNDMSVREVEGNKFECKTRYKGKIVHWQLMKKNRVAGASPGAALARGILGCDW